MNSLQKATEKHSRMHSLITLLQFLSNDIDLHKERFDVLEELREHLPTVAEIQLYSFHKEVV